MSGVEAYVAELRAALGDRLPPAVTNARLRETRSHLLASSAEVGEAEALRRYGRARRVANGLVRAHRGYGGRSAWGLGLPLGAAFLAVAVGSSLAAALGRYDGSPVVLLLDRAFLLAFVLAFCARVLQTRRWLAGPMALSHLAALLFGVCLWRAVPQRFYVSETRGGAVHGRWMAAQETERFLATHPEARRPQGITAGEALRLEVDAAAMGAAWLAVNAAALGAGRLSDLRRARRAGGAS